MHRSDFSDLNTFLAVSDHLSFRAAAAQLGVTSSALSHSIRQLEERLGIRLLHRTTRSVSLTDSGIRLLERLRPGMEQISSAGGVEGPAASAIGSFAHHLYYQSRGQPTAALPALIDMVRAPKGSSDRTLVQNTF